MTKIPENKYYLSNNLPTVTPDIKSTIDYKNGLWIINKIESYDNNKPNGQAVQTLALGDLIEYIDRELSFSSDGAYLGTIIGKVFEIKEKEVLLIKPNKERYLMGNNSQFVNYTPFTYENILPVKNTISSYLIAIYILIFVICLLILLISWWWI